MRGLREITVLYNRKAAVCWNMLYSRGCRLLRVVFQIQITTHPHKVLFLFTRLLKLMVYIFILKLPSSLRVAFQSFEWICFQSLRRVCLITENVNEAFIHALYIIYIMNVLLIWIHIKHFAWCTEFPSGNYLEIFWTIQRETGAN